MEARVLRSVGLQEDYEGQRSTLRRSKGLAQAPGAQYMASTSIWKTYDLNLSWVKALKDVVWGSTAVYPVHDQPVPFAHSIHLYFVRNLASEAHAQV